MKFERTTTPYGYCLFCEDIRHEINGKQSFVGTFVDGEMTVLGAIPAAIGKFCIHVTYWQRFADGLEPVLIEVHMPGDEDDKPTARTEINVEQNFAILPPAPPEVDDPIFGVNFGFEFNPLEVKREGRVLVSAVKAGKRYRLGSLKISAPGSTDTKEASN